jgi:VCBS repeat-containing protein
MMGMIIVILAIAGIAAFLYFRVIKKGVASTAIPAPAPTPVSGWVQQYGTVTVDARGNFTFGEPHYIVETAPALQAGQTISMKFSIAGTGKLTSVQDGGPAHVTLYMQRRGDNLSGMGAYQQYRYFGPTVELTNAAEYTLSAQLNPDQWGDVFGARGSDHPAEFAACVANAEFIGFVFGNPGAGATGHGVKATGPVSFALLDYSIK